MYEKADECYGYKAGDEIIAAGEHYYVIADSPATKDYVVALKSDFLTFAEVNSYSSGVPVSANNTNGYGAILFGSTNDYSTSYIKTVIETWWTDKFSNSELKEVDGYRARLITKSEAEAFRCSSSGWSCSKFISGYPNIYWTMTSANNTNHVFTVFHYIHPAGYNSGTNKYLVRPVINVYKSSIQKIQ